ncbi:uncharacterized protein [Anabrus simplex]|uniref:uncharacterized protein n=1 Tax=Anabrus simplex TaxID=316456 RepID=UPI0035A32A85
MLFHWNAATVIVILQLAIVCAWRQLTTGSPWATSDLEALDEQHDAEIFRAVVKSMEEWKLRAENNASHRRTRAPNGVCYDDVGCFYDSGVFGYLDMLPSPPQEVSTRFILFSTSRGARSIGLPMEIPFNNMSMAWTRRDSFNTTAPMKVIVHGFGSSCSHIWVYEMRSALMAVEDCNVICVDWEAGATVPNYVRAAANTRLVGKQLAMLLEGLKKNLDVPYEKMHLIGFSLGAHVAGFAGSELKNISRITGLDPAGPLFESQDPRARLDSSDAKFVDVIHSNGENLILGGLGSWQPMGHVDFYPNGGRMQKGCSNLFVGAVSDIIWSASEVEGRSLCNHRRAYKFFTDSVSPRCHFPAFPCESYEEFLEGRCFPCTGDRRCGNMGYYADRSAGRGTLYLVTRDEEPFCAHQYHVTLEHLLTDTPASSYGKIQITLIGSSDLNETFSLTQKDDEMLKAEQPLARIVVPHPVLLDPVKIQLLYTAYSGWWSSGSPTWAVRRVTLVDSFGKSMSVCKKELLLETGVPVTLRLYAGECNPPKSANSSGTLTPVTSTAVPQTQKPERKNSINNVTRYIPTPVVQIGDEVIPEDTADESSVEEDPLSFMSGRPSSSLRWTPLNFHDSSSNSLDDSRSFGSLTSSASESATLSSSSSSSSASNSSNDSSNNSEHARLVEHTTTAPFDKTHYQSNVTSTTGTPFPEIREPVLSPKTTTFSPTDDGTPRPSAVKTREIPSASSSFSSEDDRRLWIPSVELNPPPLGIAQTWQHWTLAKSSAQSMKTQINESTIQGLNPSSNPSILQKANRRSHQPVTIQLLPQRLAAFLAQAERYARLTFMPKSDTSVPNVESKLTKNNKEDLPSQRRGKHFTTTVPPTVDSSLFQPRMDTDTVNNVEILVPLSYSYKDDKKPDKQYIPLQYPTVGTAEEHRRSEIITITPEDLRKNFRSIKIERSTSENPSGLLMDRNTDDYTDLHPVYTRDKRG